MRSLYLSAGLLTVSLGAAWMRFTAEPDKVGANEVLVMANQVERISEIHWTSPKQDVHLYAKADELGRYLWVHYTDKNNPDVTQEKYFKAGQNGDKLLNNLSPLLGIRQLQSDADLNALGLDDPTATLTVVSNQQTRVFTIGDEAYGTRDLYIKDDQSQEIFLIDDSKLRNLRQARTSLPDRALWQKDSSQATTATITLAEQSLKLTHQNWQDRSKAMWKITAFPEQDATQIQTWMTKVLRLSVSQYAKPDEDVSGLTAVFSCTLSWDEGDTDMVNFYQNTDDTWWAETNHTRGKVRIAGSALDGLVDDLPSLFTE